MGTTPDGLLFYIYGPEVGQRHDMTLYRESGLDGILNQRSTGEEYNTVYMVIQNILCAHGPKQHSSDWGRLKSSYGTIKEWAA